MGRQIPVTITNAIKEKSSMQGKCKRYLAWKGFCEATLQLKGGKGWVKWAELWLSGKEAAP